MVISELDEHIGKALSNIELVDHLIGSPVEPFIEHADFSAYNAPLFSVILQNESRLSEFLLCAEKSGFTLDETGGGLNYRVDVCDKDRVCVRFLHIWDNRTITFYAFVPNHVLMDYHMARVIGDQA